MPVTQNKTILETKEGKAQMDKKDAFKMKLEADLSKWKAEIDRLEAQAAATSVEMKEKYKSQLKRLRDHQDEAEKRLEELGKAHGHAWEDMKTGMENAWSEFGKAVKKATDRFS